MRYLSALYFLFLCHVCHGQLQIGSLDELLEYADKNSPAARQSALQPYIAREDVNIQASGLYPKVNVFATGDYYPIIATQVIPAEVLGGQKGTYLKAQFGLPYIFSGGVELIMPVINLEKWTQLAKSRAQYRQAQWSSRVAIENLHLQIIQAYYQYLVTKTVAMLSEENVATTDVLMHVMEQRRTARVLNPADYNRSKNLQADTKVSLVNYRRSLHQAQNAVLALLHITDTGKLVIVDNLDSFSWVLPAPPEDVHNRPAMQEAEARSAVAALALTESRRGPLPKLNLNGRYAYNMQSKFEQGSSNVSFDAGNVGLRLDVPLFQGNYYRALQHKSKLLLTSAAAEQDRVAAQLWQQQADWSAQYAAAWEKHVILKGKLATAFDNLRIARLGMEENVMEFDEFNNIFLEYNRTRMEYIQNQADGILYQLLSSQKF